MNDCENAQSSADRIRQSKAIWLSTTQASCDIGSSLLCALNDRHPIRKHAGLSLDGGAVPKPLDSEHRHSFCFPLSMQERDGGGEAPVSSRAALFRLRRPRTRQASASRRDQRFSQARVTVSIVVAGARRTHFDCGQGRRQYSHATMIHRNCIYSDPRRSSSFPADKAGRLAEIRVSHRRSDDRVRSSQRALLSGRHFPGRRLHLVWRTGVGNRSRLSHMERLDLVPRPRLGKDFQQPQAERLKSTET
jgi:hypothetical protein